MSHLITRHHHQPRKEVTTSQPLVSSQRYSFAVLEVSALLGRLNCCCQDNILHFCSTHGRSKAEGTLLLSLHQPSSYESFIIVSVLLKASTCLTVVLGMLLVQKKTFLLSSVSRYLAVTTVYRNSWKIETTIFYFITPLFALAYSQ